MNLEKLNYELIRKKMECDWNKRAHINVRKYIDLKNWRTKEQFYSAGLIDAKKVINNININGNWNVLEVGIGIGRIARHLSDRFQTIYGVDISNETVNIALDELKEFDNIKILQNNGMNLSIFSDNDIFDFVYSVKVFQHMPKEIFLTYIDDIRRLLRLNGILRFQIFEKTKIGIIPWYYLRNLRNFHAKFWTDPPDLDSWMARCYTKSELHKLLTDRGFKVLSIENIAHTEEDLWITAQLIKK